MSYAVKDTIDGTYMRGATYNTVSWEKDLQAARIYPSRGAAANSINRLLHPMNRRHGGLKVVEVQIVEVVDE